MNAFNAIALTDISDSCNFTINGPRSWCEEYSPDKSLNLNVSSPFSQATYYWTFPYEWQIAGNRQGNTHEGPFLSITNIPTYSSYPALFQVYVYSPQLGASHREEITIRILDCDYDKPTNCQVSKSESSKNVFNQRAVTVLFHDDPKVSVHEERYTYQYYDMSGRLLSVLENRPESILDNQSSQLSSGVYIVVKFNSKGQYVSTTKKVIVK